MTPTTPLDLDKLEALANEANDHPAIDSDWDAYIAAVPPVQVLALIARVREALTELDFLDSEFDHHPEGCGCSVCRSLDALRAALAGADHD